ncbi:hypothetical protein J3458_001449 [Metarhizium acridum]|uniref:uncharacterized protein n=1 Tax=Metarhizium acridum TaxID=92637 RepID=UPI001C6B4B24|nr:hypothetical protein J3458_001449 [Metarhizium acridum]
MDDDCSTCSRPPCTPTHTHTLQLLLKSQEITYEPCTVCGSHSAFAGLKASRHLQPLISDASKDITNTQHVPRSAVVFAIDCHLELRACSPYDRTNGLFATALKSDMATCPLL